MRDNRFVLLILTFILPFFLVSCGKNVPGPPARGPVWLTYRAGTSGLANNYVFCIYPDNGSGVWFGTANGASFFSGSSWSTYRDSLQYSVFTQNGTETACVVSAINRGKDGSLWFGTEGGGLVRYNLGNKIASWQKYYPPDIPSSFVTSVATEIQQLGEVWVGSVGSGVGRFIPAPSSINPNDGTWDVYTRSEGHLSSDLIRAVGNDPTDNSIWMTMDGIGAIQYDITNDRWGSTYPLPAALRTAVTSIAFDQANNVWLGTWQGVYAVNANTGATLNTYVGGDSLTHGKLPYSEVNTVTTDYNVTRWFGTNNGLTENKDTSWTLFTRANTQGKLPSDTINAVAYDNHGNLWIATPNGIAAYNPKGTLLSQ